MERSKGGITVKSVFYSAQEVAELIGCSPSKAYEIIRKTGADVRGLDTGDIRQAEL